MSNLLTEGTGIILGVGVGAAAAAAIEPAAELPKQDAWSRNPNRLLEPGVLARLIAQGGIPLDAAAYDDARRDGFSSDKLDALVYLAQTVPGIGEATDLWRKGILSPGLFNHVLTKSGLDSRYVAPIVANKTAEVLGIGDIAFAVVRGILPSPSWVPVAPPSAGDKVPRFPQVDLDPLELAKMLGYDEDMLKIAVGRSGLSMAPTMAASALFRGIIGPNDYLLAIAEGDLRTEWAEAVRETARQILTSGQYAELQLRGFLTPDERRARTARHGMSTADSNLLYDLLGRSVNVHQVLIGERRGGVFEGPADQIPPAYLQSLQRGNLRPEYYNLAYAARESYPSAFVIRGLLQAGAITPERGHELFLGLGWPADVAASAATTFSGGTSSGGDKHVEKAQTQLWTTAHRSYVAAESDEATATQALTAAGVQAPSIPAVLELWAAERELVRKQLTPAQVKKAWAENVLNPTTGSAWTRDEALAALIARGYSASDANTFLEL